MFARTVVPALLTLSFAFAPGLASAASEGGSPMGAWARGDGGTKVKVAPCGQNICATNTWIKPGNKSEKVGDVLVMKVKDNGSGAYKGTAFDRQRNMNFKMTLTVAGNNMTTRGCVLGGVICKNVSWTKIQ